jgi:hypothetical protein
MKLCFDTGIAEAGSRVNSMEFPEPYHSLPIRDWRKGMKSHPKSYATLGVRAWLQNHHRYRLICSEGQYRPIDIRSTCIRRYPGVESVQVV